MKSIIPYPVSYLVSKLIFTIAFFRTPLKVYGRENIPKGSVVICSNHVHGNDPFYIVYSFPFWDKIRIMAKEEIRHMPVVGRLLDFLGIPIWVKRGQSDLGAMKLSMKTLKKGEKLLIFPEGTRHDELGEGKTGAALMAIRAKVPVLPVYIAPERKHFHRVKVYFGKPFMPFTQERKPTAEDYQKATEEIMAHIAAIRDSREEMEAQCKK